MVQEGVDAAKDAICKGVDDAKDDDAKDVEDETKDSGFQTNFLSVGLIALCALFKF